MNEPREPLPRTLAAKMRECPQFFDILEEYTAHTIGLRKDTLVDVLGELDTALLRGEIRALRNANRLRVSAENVLNNTKPVDNIR